ncbi:hypothetical protein COBT_001713 [Conglomerata obtusa]
MDRIFVENDVESYVNERFNLEGAIPVNYWAFKYVDVAYALKTFQKNINEYINCTRHITIENIRNIIEEITKTLSKRNRMNSQSSKGNYYCKITRYDASPAFHYYQDIIHKLSKFLFLSYLDLSHSISSFQDCFNRNFFYNLHDASLDDEKNFWKVLITIIEVAASENPPSFDFNKYFDDNVATLISKTFESILEKVNYICRHLKKQSYHNNVKNIKKYEVLHYDTPILDEKVEERIKIVKTICEDLNNIISELDLMFDDKACDKLVQFCTNKLVFMKNNLDTKKPESNIEIIKELIEEINQVIELILSDLRISMEEFTLKFLETNKYILVYGYTTYNKTKNSLDKLWNAFDTLQQKLQFVTEHNIFNFAEFIYCPKNVGFDDEIQICIQKIKNNIDNLRSSYLSDLHCFEADLESFISELSADERNISEMSLNMLVANPQTI